MKPMPDFELRAEPIRLNADAVQHLDRLCQALEKIQSGDAQPDVSTLAENLAALARLFDPAPEPAAASHWSAEYYPAFSGDGGTLSLKEQSERQHLTISRNRQAALYNGIWTCLDENNPAVLMFNVQPSPTGYQLKISGDEMERSIALGNNVTGFKWASPDDVLSFIPEWLAANVKAAIQVVLPPQPALPAAAAPVPKPQPLPPPPTVVTQALTWHLVVQPGGQTMALKGKLSIGREQDNDLYLEDKKLSRHHAVIEAAANGWQVRDLGSTNGTWVKGQRISAPLLLKAGDAIELGDIRLTLELR